MFVTFIFQLDFWFAYLFKNLKQLLQRKYIKVCVWFVVNFNYQFPRQSPNKQNCLLSVNVKETIFSYTFEAMNLKHSLRVEVVYLFADRLFSLLSVSMTSKQSFSMPRQQDKGTLKRERK